MSIRDRILERLDALGLSARAASVNAGLNTHFLQKYLNNENHSMRVENLVALAEVLETTPEWLLSGKEERPAEDPELGKVVDYWSRRLDRDARERVLGYMEYEANKGKRG